MLEVLFHPLRFYWDYANTNHGRGDGGGCMLTGLGKVA